MKIAPRTAAKVNAVARLQKKKIQFKMHGLRSSLTFFWEEAQKQRKKQVKGAPIDQCVLGILI